MTTTIIIVKFNLKWVEDQCIRAVVDHTKNYNLIVHDNFPQNENLGKLWNRLIKQSKTKYICLLNSDTLVTPHWLELLLECFEKPKVGVAGPSSNKTHNPQSKDHWKEPLVDFGKTYPNWCLSGFCLVFPKKVWEKVGGFPENYGFYGQEVAFIDKLTKLKYKQAWRTDSFVYHYGSASLKKAGISRNKEQKKAAKRRENANKNL